MVKACKVHYSIAFYMLLYGTKIQEASHPSGMTLQ